MTIKSTLAALAAKLPGFGKPDTNTQAGPRAGQDGALNYMSVQTLDPARLANAFAAADQGDITHQATLFELIEEHDPHIFSELAKRRRAVTGLGWQLHPKDDAPQSELDRCKELTDMFRAIPRVEDALYDLTDGIGKGFAALEIEWRLGAEWTPKAMHWVPQRLMRIERTTGQMLYLKNGIPEPLRPSGWVVHEHRSKSGYIEQAALFRVLAWTYAYKAYNTMDMQKFLEKYGMPLRLGRFPSGIGKDQQATLLKAVRNIGSDGAGVVPDTMSIEFVQAMKSGTIDDFLSAILYWERKQSMAILGGTLTSQADGKTATNALGVVHDKVRREIMLHDVRQLEPTIGQQWLTPMASYNGMFTPDRMPGFAFDTAETVDQKMMVEVLSKAADMGLDIDVSFAHQALQIPKAAEGATLLKGSTRGNAGGAGAALTRLVALANNKAKDSGEADPMPAYIAQLTALAAPHEQAMVQQIAALVADAGGYDEAIEALEQLAITTRPKALAETIALGLATANLAGKASV
ncbi:DUF935 domain-containing protein [Rhodoferax sp. BLA1]|uniref:DUF935 domain-containing protein n=1 Tax=Rhodoferax sp. BLA1 TaxID=2576062 RepID=UPI0015D450F9|nr:DUF935 family protein [Rhodoferax sp. BLA1]